MESIIIGNKKKTKIFHRRVTAITTGEMRPALILRNMF